MKIFVQPLPERTESAPNKKKRKLLYRFLDYREKIGKGNQWMAILNEYIPIDKGVDWIFTYIIIRASLANNPTQAIIQTVIGYVVYKAFYEILRLVIAIFYWKTGAWKAQLDWEKKNEKYQGPELEKRKTIASIAEKLGAENYIKDLDHE